MAIETDNYKTVVICMNNSAAGHLGRLSHSEEYGNGKT